MALQVNNNVEVLGGLTTNKLYIRFYYSINQNGKNIHTVPMVYASKEAYLENPANNIKGIKQISDYYDFSYDREVNGTDPLLYIHDIWKDKLTTDIFKNVPYVVDSSIGLDYDPSTGQYTDPSTGGIWYEDSQYLYDPDTNQVLTYKVLEIPKLAESDEIEYVDL